MTSNDFERSSGNVFADLGLPNADENIVKAELVLQLRKLIEERGLTQKAAAGLLGIHQPDLSDLLRGAFHKCSVESLMRFLTVFDCEVDIVLREKGEEKPKARIRFQPAA